MLALNKPDHFFKLLFLTFWDRFVYVGFQASVVLLLIATVGHAHSLVFYGAFTALAYSLPYVGGKISDYFKVKDQLLFFSVLLAVAGLLLDSFVHSLLFMNVGFSMFLVGMSLYRPIISSRMSGQNHTAKDSERAYSFYYMAMNCGAILGPLVIGFISLMFSWSLAFWFGAAGFFLMALFLFFSGAQSFSSFLGKQFLMGFSAAALVCVACFFVLTLPKVASIAFAILFLWFVVWLYRQAGPIIQKGYDRRLFFIALLVSFFFFYSEIQVGGILTLYIKTEIHPEFWGFKVPIQFFSSIAPVSTLLALPFFIRARKGKTHEPKKLLKQTRLGLSLGISSFLLFSVSTLITFKSLKVLCLLVGFPFLGVGEMMIVPAMMSFMRGIFSDAQVGAIMGGWLLISGAANYLSGIVSGFLAPISHLTTNPFFFQIALTLLISILTLFASFLIGHNLNRSAFNN